LELTTKSLGMKTISQLNKDYVKHLVQTNKNMEQHRIKMQKHKRARKQDKGVSLAQTSSDLNIEAFLNQDKPKVVKGKASVKAPTDPKKLQLVQINNEKPPSHKLRPNSVSLLQINTDQSENLKNKISLFTE
jgi:hypothetical protein